MNIIIVALVIGVGLVVVLVVALVIFLILRSMARSTRQVQDDFDRAMPASATVLHVGQSSSAGSYGTVDVELTLQVDPPMGNPYQVRTTWAVDPAAIAKIQAGQTVAVRIHRDNPQKVYSAESWAQSLELRQDPPDDPND